MINHYEFKKMLKDFNLNSTMHECLALSIWSRCERAMQGQTNQEPRLLKKQNPAFEEFTQISHSELQQLQSLLKTEISALNTLKKLHKTQANYAWTFADEQRPEETEISFNTLNRSRNLLRSVEKQIKKKESIQQKIKKLLKTKDRFTS